MDRKAFRNWLEANTTLKKKSIYDIISRLARASKLIDIDSKYNYEELVDQISKTKGFNNCGNQTRSHIKRSIYLYTEYLSRDS